MRGFVPIEFPPKPIALGFPVLLALAFIVNAPVDEMVRRGVALDPVANIIPFCPLTCTPSIPEL